MTGEDDRLEFEHSKRKQASAMAADPVLRRDALALTAVANRYDWSYQWTWLGVPIIQLPPDVMALQEIVWAQRPQVIVETGVARGGSVIFFASLMEMIGEGKVIGIDIDIRPHNRGSVESHPLAHRVQLIEGSSIDPDVVANVARMVAGADRVMVVLDSDHTHAHVLAELLAYHSLVTRGQFLVVADTAIEFVPPSAHRPRDWGPGNSPLTAVREFLRSSADFTIDQETEAKLLMTANPGGFLRRNSPGT